MYLRVNTDQLFWLTLTQVHTSWLPTISKHGAFLEVTQTTPITAVTITCAWNTITHTCTYTIHHCRYTTREGGRE